MIGGHVFGGGVFPNLQQGALLNQAPFNDDLYDHYKVVAGEIISENTNIELLPPCFKFTGVLGDCLLGSSLLNANEVEIRFKTTSTERIAFIGVNGFGTIQLDGSGNIVAGTASVLGNAIAAPTATDGNWHTIRVVKTGTANVFDIYFDGVLGDKKSDGSYRDSLYTGIGIAQIGPVNGSLYFIGEINRVAIKNESSEITNEWVFIENKNTSYVYDLVGEVDFPRVNKTTSSYASGAIDYAKTKGASLVIDDTNNILLVPYKTGNVRQIPLIFGSVLINDVSDCLPFVSYGINFNPETSDDAKYNYFKRSNTDVFNDFARSGEYSDFIFDIEDLTRSLLMSWCNVGYKGHLFPKLTYYNNIPIKLEELLVYTTNQTGANQTKILNYTKDVDFFTAFDVNDNALLSAVNYSNTIENPTGGLYTRLLSSDPSAAAIATIFDNHGFKATFVERTPADIDAPKLAILKSLQDSGHDVGFWFDKSNYCVKLLNASWAEDYLNMDSGYTGNDIYGSELKGIQEVITFGDAKYLCLTWQIRYKIEDAIIQPIHGTDRIKITNLPEDENANLYEFAVLMPDDPIIPENLRNKWATCGSPSSQTLANREFPIQMYAYFSMSDYGSGTFTNPDDLTLVTSVGVDMVEESAPYTAYQRAAVNTNTANERARYYVFHHAIRAFEALGLERPFIVGESHNTVNENSLATTPLELLQYVSAGVEPIQKGHTYYMNQMHRWNFATRSNPAYTPIDSDGSAYDNAIGFNVGVANPYTAAQAFDRVVYAFAKNRWIAERQTFNYTETELTKWDDLLTLCENNNIPVLTMKELGITLFDSKFSTNFNPIPNVSLDLNSDSLPDGYQPLPSGSTWDLNGISNTGRFIRSSNGDFFKILNLGGILQGKNNCRLNAYGKIGDLITITVLQRVQSYAIGVRPDLSTTFIASTIKFTIAQNDTWAEIISNTPLLISGNVYFVDITATLTKSATAGNVYCGQLSIGR